jgi:uncharacterized protein (TIGR02246 family)
MPVAVDPADESAIRSVLARYCHTCDDGAFDALVALFTADGSFSYAGRTVAGRAALAAYFAEVQTPERRGKHLVANTVMAVSGDRAEVRSDWAFLAFTDGVLVPRLTGRYDDVLVRDGGDWLIAERVVTPLQPA